MRRAPRRPPTGTLTGVALTALGALGFASKGIFAKFLYADGWGVEATVATRSFLALPILAVWALTAVGPRALLRPSPRVIFGAAFAGVLTFYVGSMLDFKALTMIDASVERVLLFTYPSMIVVLYAALYRQWPERRVLGALTLTYAGILMVVTGLDLRVLHGNLAGAGLVLGCALMSACYYLASDRWTPSIGSVGFTFYALGAATLCLGLHVAVSGTHGGRVWEPRDLWLLAGLVLIATVMPIVSMAEGVRRLGAQRAAVVSTIGPPATIVLGAWLIGERLHAAQWLGVALIVAGILALELTERAAADAAGGTS